MAAAAIRLTATTVTELAVGQVLRGRTGSYQLSKLIYDGVWHATACVICGYNERDMLERFQHRTAYLQPLIDEIQDPADPPAIVPRWLDDDVAGALGKQALTKSEIKQVAKSVLEALKPRNMPVNYRHGRDGPRFREVQLTDLGGAIHRDSEYTKEGHSMGTDRFRSPEAQLNDRAEPSSDILSFGITILYLSFGGIYHPFESSVPAGHPEYHLQIVMKYYHIMGPWPLPWASRVDDETLTIIACVAENSPKETLRPLAWVKDKEIDEEDRRFLLHILKLDVKDRPSARGLLEDKWLVDGCISSNCSMDQTVVNSSVTAL
ncbi:hypothetical protein K458DRAFT_446460 [Lentithecium fluviatile CBS 122367]|uniref:Protein kinase domain-containing protein n=1 Tax=Lentithecium fluviatile CBS 122367 TaxID=1168545 RepID=A0A6G1IK10_9PLEO|nr:hypothetical protein K458DRAFT_446460 [Lentithecium fluviatile CBS 122367]